MAAQHAVFLVNHMPRLNSGLSPQDLFSKTRWPQRKFHDPVCMLEKQIADGEKSPQWKPRSHRSMMVGLSAKHATTAPLTLNPETGHIAPQFHVAFDDWFAAASSSEGELPDMHSPEWSKLLGDAAFQHLPSELELPEQDSVQVPSQAAA